MFLLPEWLFFIPSFCEFLWLDSRMTFSQLIQCIVCCLFTIFKKGWKIKALSKHFNCSRLFYFQDLRHILLTTFHTALLLELSFYSVKTFLLARSSPDLEMINSRDSRIKFINTSLVIICCCC